jgi:hypothetical protein
MVSPFPIDTFFPSLRTMQAEFDIDALYDSANAIDLSIPVRRGVFGASS